MMGTLQSNDEIQVDRQTTKSDDKETVIPKVLTSYGLYQQPN